MSITKTILRNVAANWLGFLVQVAVTFFLTPFVIKSLGTEAYGVWLLIQSTVGYYGLIDIGLRSGLTQAITRRIAKQDSQSVLRHLGAAMPILALLGLVVLLVASVVGCYLPQFAKIGPPVSESIFAVMMIQALAVAVQMPLTPLSAVIVGHQRYDLANLVSISTALLNGLATWLVLRAGGGLVGLAIVGFAVNSIACLLRGSIAWRLQPDLSQIRFNFDRAEIRELSTVTIWNSLISLSRQLIGMSDAIVVSIVLSAKAIPPFGIALSLVDYGFKMITMSTKVLFPTLTHLRINNDEKTLRSVYLTSTRMSFAIMAAFTILGSKFIRPFLSLWLSNDEETASIIQEAPHVFAILGCAAVFAALQRPGIQLQIAANELRKLALFFFFEGLLNLFLSLLLGHFWGIYGVAYGTLLPAVLACFILHLPAHARLLRIGYIHLVLQICVRPVVLMVILFASSQFLFAAGWGGGDDWLSFLVSAGAFTIFASLLGALTILEKEQRQALLRMTFDRFHRLGLQS